MARLIPVKRRATVYKITIDLNQGFSQIISKRTDRRTLHLMEYGTPAVNKKKHLQLAQGVKGFAVSLAKIIMLADESRF